MKGVSTHNRRIVGTGPDFYPTPRWGTLALLEHVGFKGLILEPCCGEGDMSEVLVEHGYALKIVDRKVCLLLRLAFAESKRRYEKFYRDNPPQKVLVFSERLSMYPKGSPVMGGGTTSYAWFCWSRGHIGPTTMEWINPGLKNGPETRVGRSGT